MKNQTRNILSWLSSLASILVVIILLFTSYFPNIRDWLSGLKIVPIKEPKLEEQVLATIGSTLDTLYIISIGAMIAIIIAAFSALYRDKKIKIGTLEVEKKFAGTTILIFLCGVSFFIFSLFQTLASALGKTGTITEKAVFIVNNHPWIMNPFRETTGPFGVITDHLGFALLLLGWWIGFYSAFLLLQHGKSKLDAFIVILCLIYLVFGILSMVQVSMIIRYVDVRTAILKQALLFGAIPIGAIGFGKIASDLWQKGYLNTGQSK